ncbi:hypothetical protein C5D82_000768 [Salmonella enterica]|uniref:Uncharacterized protein n=1 Tax=Salmonella diarizonae TaxID=59204 RepID=A0A6C8XWP0_SALDZ|nr:hypothetical protein [Salmonella enterica subsp. diarizonae]EDX7835833.1 hypothetical protein [Salmonella enterica]EEE1929850.1 hypothetical protein [Salmonella enterica subsp. diarizonae]MIE70637.1 hypothetical protein [Salmonella enterica subsp. diarizonae]
MLRIKRKQPSQWSRCRHASLCSSKQSGSIHKIIQVASQNALAFLNSACAGCCKPRTRIPGAYIST